MATLVHSVRFYNIKPVSIKCMAIDQDKKRLAVGRVDNTIEIWNISHTPHLERTILGVFDVIEGFDWYKGRLFSVGLQGSVIEYDLFKQMPKSMHPVTSGSCWCISIKTEISQLAAGTEDGYINIFNIEDDEIVYKKILDKQEGKVLSIAWNSTGTHLVTGSLDTVRIWDVESGHAVHRMTTGRVHASKETLVWSLVVTDDFTIISGDSRGKLCFWDGKVGLSISSYQTHKADVLAVCLAEDQSTVYCAGVDPLIATYERVKVRDEDERGKWVRSTERFIHDHNVHSMVICGNKLYSAGIDGYLALSYPPKILFKYPPLLQSPAVHCSSRKRLLLLRYPYSIDIWRLGQKDVSPPVKLLDWKPPSEVRIRCAALSPDGFWMACSTQESFRMYSLYLDEEKPRICKAKVSTKQNLVSHAVCFSPDSSRLVLGTIKGTVVCLALSLGQQPSMLHCFNAYKEKELKDSIKSVAVSSDSEYIAAADIQSNIVIWRNGEIHAKLPKYDCPITSMAIQPSTNLLVLVFANHKVMEYSLKKKKYTKFSKTLQEQHPKQLLLRYFPVHNIAFDERNENIIILHDDSTIFVINKDKELPDIEAKIPRLGRHLDDSPENSNQHPFNETPEHAFHVLDKKYKHLVFFGALSEGEMVAVEVSPSTLFAQLPPASRRERFGRK